MATRPTQTTVLDGEPEAMPSTGSAGANGGASVPQLYTVSETAALLRIGRSSLYELMATGQLRSITIGSRRLIAAEDLAFFVAGRRAGAA